MTLFAKRIWRKKNVLVPIKGKQIIVTANKPFPIHAGGEFLGFTKKITVKVSTFSPSIKSKFKFVTESYDSGKVDYYFTSPEEPANKSLQEDIRSFFEALT